MGAAVSGMEHAKKWQASIWGDGKIGEK